MLVLQQPQKEKPALVIWDLNNGKELKRWPGHQALVFAVALTPDGKRGLSADQKGVLKVWDVEQGKEVREIAAQKNGVMPWPLPATANGPLPPEPKTTSIRSSSGI